MAANPPSNSKSPGDDRNLVPVDENYKPVTFEDRLNLFWKKNRMAVMALCGLVFLAIVGKGVWERVQHQNELGVESAYASANTPEQLRAFVDAHPSHELAGVAEIRLGDDAYTAEKAADALAAYEKAQTILKSGPLATRARLGAALAKVQLGKTADGTADLKQLLNDSTQFKAARAEAAYQLASLAADAHNAADVQHYAEQLTQIDPTSPWTQRAMMLRASLPTPAAAPAPAATAPAAAGKEGAGPNVQIKLPGK